MRRTALYGIILCLPPYQNTIGGRRPGTPLRPTHSTAEPCAPSCARRSLLAHGDHDCLGPHGVTSSAKPSPGLVGAALLSASSPAQPPLGKLSGRGLGDGREHCYADVIELHYYRYITSPHRRGSAHHLFSTKSYLGLVSCRCACLTVVTRETD